MINAFRNIERDIYEYKKGGGGVHADGKSLEFMKKKKNKCFMFLCLLIRNSLSLL